MCFLLGYKEVICVHYTIKGIVLHALKNITY